MSQPQGGGELALLTFGAILLAGAVQRSGDAAVAGVRADYLHKFGLVRRRWHRRAATASTSLEAVLGVAVVAYALVRVARAITEGEPSDGTPTDTSPQGAPPDAPDGWRVATAA
jgi:hypothetical protein